MAEPTADIPPLRLSAAVEVSRSSNRSDLPHPLSNNGALSSSPASTVPLNATGDAASPPTPAYVSRHTSVFRLAAANANPLKYNVPEVASSHHQETVGWILWDVTRHLLPSLCSPRPIRRQFARVLDTAVRGAIAFIVASVLATQPWSVDVLAIPYLMVVFSTVSVRPTVGSTIINIDAQGKVPHRTSHPPTAATTLIRPVLLRV